MKLSENFSLSEFRCNDGTDVPEEYMDNVKKLTENLQILRDIIGKPIIVISGYRSPDYNKKISGVKRSQHMLAKAADIIIRGMDTRDVANLIKDLIKQGKMHSGGVGLYETFVHYDVRGRNARWYGKGMKP